MSHQRYAYGTTHYKPLIYRQNGVWKVKLQARGPDWSVLHHRPCVQGRPWDLGEPAEPGACEGTTR